MRVVHVVSSLVAAALIAACTLATTKGDDGASCAASSDCKSGTCTGATCAGSTCSCSGQCAAGGAPSRDCESGWVCVYYPPDAISGFFGASGSSSCAATCGNCPEHWSCAPGDTLCTYDSGWTSPQVTIVGPTTGVAGEALSFHADATSAIGAKIVTYDWSFDELETEMAQGADAMHVYANAGAYTIQVLVTDDDSGPAHSPNGSATIQVTICAPRGQACVDSSSCCGGATCQSVADAGATHGMLCE